MDLDVLENYTTLIQLISAVNFAYIFTRFHENVYKLFFDEKKLIEEKFMSFINDITVDKESLQSMEPIETTNGKSNKDVLATLKSDYEQLLGSWEQQKRKMTGSFQKVKDVKGVRSLFLFVSLFCLMDLFDIATNSWVESDFIGLYSHFFPLFSIIAPFLISIFILCFTWKEKSEVSCYKWTSTAFIITVILSLLLAYIIDVWLNFDVNLSFCHKEVLLVSIIMPFYACFFSVLYIVGYGMYFNLLARIDTKEIKKKQKELHGRKIALDASYNMFGDTSTPKFA